MSELEVRTQSYGKSAVRLSTVARDGDQHSFTELTLGIELSGDFDAAYDSADNALVVPTDTMKNTVYALAKRHGLESLEAFCRLLGRHFVDRFAHVDMATVAGEESLWKRLELGDGPHPHAFVSAAGERGKCTVTAVADDLTQECGFTGLKVLKTTGSAFEGYLVDEFTTLKPTDDRIFATTIDASWSCPQPMLDWSAVRSAVRHEVLAVFANQHSESVQHTLYEMGKAALARCPELEALSLTMPNQHHLLANLEPFGMENPNEVFVPTDEPHGNISATIGRAAAESP
ncbi:MAG: factor-independent urate hydroxylase [Planctomycetota bacterium]